MMAQRVQHRPRWQVAGLALAVLACGVVVGFAAIAFIYPAPRERALLWDDYILATAALYRREGDIARARERLQKLPSDDPARTVAALAAVYVAEPELGEDAATALRDLASALTGRTVAGPAQPEAGVPRPQPSVLPPEVVALGRSQLSWIALCLLSASWLGLVLLHRRRGARPARATAAAPLSAQPPEAARPAAPPKPRAREVAEPPGPTTAPAAPPTPAAAEAAPLVVTLMYKGESDSFESVVPLTSPATRRLVGGCGMTSGPAAPGADGGFLGFLVWVHEKEGSGITQAVGLVSETARRQHSDAVMDWMAFARLEEVMVARPGTVRTLETRHLRVVASVTEVAYAGKAQRTVFKRLGVRLEVTFKKRTGRIARQTGPTPP